MGDTLDSLIGLVRGIFVKRPIFSWGLIISILTYVTKTATFLHEFANSILGLYVPTASIWSFIFGSYVTLSLNEILRKKRKSTITDEDEPILRYGSTTRKLVRYVAYTSLIATIIIPVVIFRYHFSSNLNSDHRPLVIVIDKFTLVGWEKTDLQQRMLLALEKEFDQIWPETKVQLLNPPDGINNTDQRLEWACAHGADVVLYGKGDENTIWPSIRRCKEALPSLEFPEWETAVNKWDAAGNSDALHFSSTEINNRDLEFCFLSQSLPNRVSYIALMVAGLVCFFDETIIPYPEARYKQAESLFERALELEAHSSGCNLNYCKALFYHGLSCLYLAMGDKSELSRKTMANIAADQFGKAVQLDGEFSEAKRRKVQALVFASKPIEALCYSDSVLQVDQRDAGMWSDRSLILHSMKRDSEALASVEKAVELDSTDAWLWYNRGVISSANGDNLQALSSYDKSLSLAPANSSAWDNRGNSLVRLRRFSEALISYNRGLEIDSANARLWANRASVMITVDSNLLALSSCDMAIKIDTSLAIAYHNKGVAFLNLESLDSARLYLKWALLRKEKAAVTWARLGDVYYAMNFMDSAAQCYDTALFLEPRLPEVRWRRSDIYASFGSYSAAEASIAAAIELDSLNPKYWLTAAWIRFQAGGGASAFEFTRKSLEIDPYLPLAWSLECLIVGKTDSGIVGISSCDSARKYDQGNWLQPPIMFPNVMNDQNEKVESHPPAGSSGN